MNVTGSLAHSSYSSSYVKNKVDKSARRELEDTQKRRSSMRWVFGLKEKSLRVTKTVCSKNLLQFNSGAIVCMKLLRWRVNILLFHLHKQPTGSYQLDAGDSPKNQTMWSLHRLKCVLNWAAFISYFPIALWTSLTSASSRGQRTLDATLHFLARSLGMSNSNAKHPRKGILFEREKRNPAGMR